MRDENKMGTPRKECPQLPAEKERPQVPNPQLHQPEVLCGVVDAVVVYGGRYVGRCGLHSILRVAHGNTGAHGSKHRQVVLAIAKGNRFSPCMHSES